MANLSRTNTYFWNFGQERVNSWVISQLGLLARKSLITVGNQLPGEEFPVELLPEGQRVNFEDHCQPLFGETGNFFSYQTGGRSCPDMSRDTNELRTHSIVKKMLGSNRENVVKFFCSRFSSCYREDEEYVLRNLTTKELVRAKSVCIDRDRYLGTDFKNIRFGEAVMVRIFRARDDGALAAMRFREDGEETSLNIPNGPWAGHRFDIYVEIACGRDQGRGVERCW
ncbi:hypothetical protein PHISCL_09377 [Aspergillus sclerotialis]|uniref:Uncharacterized protein n=1 Tax=Aspergillus sclerotialis TaxID=2070753 RepID=A0A3A2Z5B8_9EURO|nr:hypothetical protein PHISCL_09377 [Aspergillus sclerotialis]